MAAASPEKATGAKRARTDVAAAAGPTTLYSYWRSSCSWRVRIALAFKEVPYEYVAVHLLKDGGEQLKDDYAAKNPMREVPCLEIDGQTLTQSTAILEYLEETRSTPSLLPSDPADKAQVRALCNMIGADIQPVQNLRVLKHLMAKEESAEAKTAVKLGWGKHWIASGFRGLEAALQKTAGKYCFGDEVTLADLYLVPQVFNANRFKVDMDDFPTIARINEELSKLPAFQAAHPTKQPDANS